MAWFDYARGLGAAAGQGLQQFGQLRQQQQVQGRQRMMDALALQELQQKQGDRARQLFVEELGLQDPNNVNVELAARYPDLAKQYLQRNEAGSLSVRRSPLAQKEEEARMAAAEAGATSSKQQRQALELIQDPVKFDAQPARIKAAVLTRAKIPQEQWGAYLSPKDMDAIVKSSPDYIRQASIAEIGARGRREAAAAGAGRATERDERRYLQAQDAADLKNYREYEQIRQAYHAKLLADARKALLPGQSDKNIPMQELQQQVDMVYPPRNPPIPRVGSNILKIELAK